MKANGLCKTEYIYQILLISSSKPRLKNTIILYIFVRDNDEALVSNLPINHFDHLAWLKRDDKPCLVLFVSKEIELSVTCKTYLTMKSVPVA